jgi:hypothetical protein
VNGGVIINDAGKHDVNGVGESACFAQEKYLREKCLNVAEADPARAESCGSASGLRPNAIPEQEKIRGSMETEN